MMRRQLTNFIAGTNVTASIRQEHTVYRMNRLQRLGYSAPSSFINLLQGKPKRAVTPQDVFGPNWREHVAADSSKLPPPSPPSPKGIAQDHFYTPDEGNFPTNPKPESDLQIHQDAPKTPPLADGTANPPQSNHHQPLPEEAKRPQHQYEASIPAVSAGPLPGVTETRRDVKGQADINSEELSEGVNGGSFYLRHGVVSGTLSNLPKVKIPRAAEGEQPESLEEIGAMEFYTQPVHKRDDAKGMENVPGNMEGIQMEVFHSRRTRGLLQSQSRVNLPQKKEQEQKGQVTKYAANKEMRMSDAEKSVTEEIEKIVGQEKMVDEEVKELAADISKEVDRASNSVLETPAKAQQPYQMTASRVPSSQLGRLFHYGGLAAGLAWGAASESVRRVAGGAGDVATGVMFSEANVERLVKKLSRMRGAALKLGQMMSFQDSKMLPAPIQEVLSRVQDSADYMPAGQRDSVLRTNLGVDWRDLFSEFLEVPMAAASIGQVHSATLASNGMKVAVKIQYPGVAASISSDLNNLGVLLTASRLLPKGLYLDKTIANARTELGWECDYVRERECAKRFAEILKPESDVFRVPRMIDEACGPQVLTMELMTGTAVTKAMKNLTQDERDFIGTQILGLCFREVAKYRFMQTDPNWTNFLWNATDRKIELLDFGASREFPTEFIEHYTGVLRAAARNDLNTVRQLSVKLGYLTGLESEAMTNAHISSILTLAEPFSTTAPEIYDFSNQTVTDRVKENIPLMIRERLAPPPEETYSLHRKLSGAFLLCARLGSRVPSRKIFVDALGE